MKDAIARQGYARHGATLDTLALKELETLFDHLPLHQPGARIDPKVAEQLSAAQVAGEQVKALIGPSARPVRALLFDKNDATNWALGWHQDRTIEVAAEVNVPGYGPFTRKQGRLHVAPPIELVEQMLTVRLHLDPVGPDNAPLVVAAGSHRFGFIAEDDIPAAVAQCEEATCLAKAGTMWFYATPILHRSARSTAGARRRVLQLDFAACPLPGGLVWARDRTTA